MVIFHVHATKSHVLKLHFLIGKTDEKIAPFANILGTQYDFVHTVKCVEECIEIPTEYIYVFVFCT